jgi:purine-binding chemotaxis protein CheW
MSSVWQYLTLGLGRETFGIDIEHVREILDYRVPEAPTPATRIILLDIPMPDRGLRVGFVADRVIEVTELDGAELEAAPEVGGRWRSSYIAGLGRRGDAFVVVFDLVALMAGDAPALALAA